MIGDLDEVQWAYLLDPTFELVNTAGKPLTDGWIEVYIHGTRSKYYCAKDFDGTLHEFKIPLDSLGANIVLASPAHAYDVYVYNKFGSLVMSRYNVVPATGDGAVIKDVVAIKSEDGTVDVNTSDQTNWDLSIKGTVDRVEHNEQEISNIKVDIENANNNITNLTEVVNNHTTEIGQIKEDVQGIESTLTNKKDKQSANTFTGSATKTIKNISQNANGELTVEFEDIDLPSEVPNVEITSPNGTIDVQSSTDVQTNTKTFTIDVNKGAVPYAIGNGSITFTAGSYYTDGKVSLSNIKSSGIEYANNKDGWVLKKDHVYVIAYNIIASTQGPSNELIGGRIWLDGFIESDQVWKFVLDSSYSHDESLTGTAIVCTNQDSEVHLNMRYDNNNLKSIPLANVNKVEIADITSIVGQGGGSGDNDKVAIDANAVPGYLEDVLVSDSDIVTLVKLGNKLHVQVNTAYTADPKLSTCDEAVINGATNNYGSYALNSGYDKLIWNDPNSYSWLNASVHQMKRLCTSQGTVTKCNLAICGSLSLTTPPAFINCCIFDTNGILLGSTGLRLYGTDFFSGSELVSFDMSEAIEGALKLKHNTYYIIQIVTCGLQLASLTHADSYNYNYDYDLRMNLQGTTSEANWKNINALTERATQIPWISFAASPNV